MTTAHTAPVISQVDVRGPRFVAWVTTTVLIITLAVSAVSPVAAAVILGFQAVAFAIGALLGPHRAPYGAIFRTLIQPRLSPVTEREPIPPLQFAQLLGFTFAAVGTIGFATGVTLLGQIVTAFALGAGFLNAAFGICLGCQLYPLVTRFRRTQPSAQ
ncbi:DUF4395 domain-containing protein [Mycobacterium sp. D16R24]|uniref:DUF4395 domain-containing protein n=1 Tax=Mycobacterium sp. D16R24 TaxID=1855656 RepID=UPI000991E4EF|nr:DUF4395 domain-containing protein [Mycobacterium sp. D16R24]